MNKDNFTLAAYGALLNTALKSDYRFLKYRDIGREKSPNTCLLRHDVDAELLGCDPILDIEAARGVKATYFLMTRSTAYNLFCLEGRRMVERLLKDGHDVGLHFMGELCENDNAAELADKVLGEVAWLKREFGSNISAVSFHQPTAAILDGEIAVDGLVNTYNKRQMGDYFYVSDTNMNWRQEHPAEIFTRHLHSRLQLLIHPIWWTAANLPAGQKWLAVLRRNVEIVVAHWQQRERTLASLNLADGIFRPDSERRSKDG